MTDPENDYFVSSRADDPFTALENERRRLDELGRVWTEETTTVQAKDRSFSMTFDGRGELTDIAFKGTKYRTVAPAEFAHLLVTTLQAGRQASLEKMVATMTASWPGVDLMGLATGKADPRAVLDSLIEPLVGDLESVSLPRPAPDRAGWES